jgi:hypothetical protein
MGKELSTYAGEERCCRVLVVKPEGGTPFGRTRLRWEDNIKMGLRAVGWDSMD